MLVALFLKLEIMITIYIIWQLINAIVVYRVVVTKWESWNPITANMGRISLSLGIIVGIIHLIMLIIKYLP